MVGKGLTWTAMVGKWLTWTAMVGKGLISVDAGAAYLYDQLPLLGPNNGLPVPVS